MCVSPRAQNSAKAEESLSTRTTVLLVTYFPCIRQRRLQGHLNRATLTNIATQLTWFLKEVGAETSAGVVEKKREIPQISWTSKKNCILHLQTKERESLERVLIILTYWLPIHVTTASDAVVVA